MPQISSKKRTVLSSGFLCVIGYTVPLVVVAVSAAVDPKGYGSEQIMTFKTLAQFVILGCSWILGFFTNGRKELEILFLILNSQQGTVIFLVYCVFNNESEVSIVRGGSTSPDMGGLASLRGGVVEFPRSVSVGKGRTSVPRWPGLRELPSQHCLEGEGDTQHLCHDSDRDDRHAIECSEGGGRPWAAISHGDSREPEAS
ncbi:unnamed protein product [Leuciscus chuanchicus]